jgi:signal peptidase
VQSSKTLPATLSRPSYRGFVRWVASWLFVVAMAVPTLALAAAVLPRALGYSSIVVTGGSMGSAIPVGSLVLARAIPSESVRVGEIILVREETERGLATPKIHRVTWLGRDGDRILARTKGDANQTEDPGTYILPDSVLTPFRSVRYLGYLVAFVQTPFGWMLLLVLPAVYLCTVALRSIWTTRSHDSTEMG